MQAENNKHMFYEGMNIETKINAMQNYTEHITVI